MCQTAQRRVYPWLCRSEAQAFTVDFRREWKVNMERIASESSPRWWQLRNYFRGWKGYMISVHDPSLLLPSPPVYLVLSGGTTAIDRCLSVSTSGLWLHRCYTLWVGSEQGGTVYSSSRMNVLKLGKIELGLAIPWWRNVVSDSYCGSEDWIAKTPTPSSWTKVIVRIHQFSYEDTGLHLLQCGCNERH